MFKDEFKSIELRLTEYLSKEDTEVLPDCGLRKCQRQARHILTLLAPELEKARANTSPLCKCPLWDDDKRECTSEYGGCIFNDVVDALEKESR